MSLHPHLSSDCKGPLFVLSGVDTVGGRGGGFGGRGAAGRDAGCNLSNKCMYTDCGADSVPGIGDY